MQLASTEPTGLKLTRLNHDSSWLVELDGTRLLLDPWTDGAAVVGFAAIHTAKLGRPTLPASTLQDLDGLVLSHPFADHCNAATLRSLSPDLPLYAPPIAAWLARRYQRFSEVHVLPDTTRGAPPTRVGNVELAWCRAAPLFDTTHNALVMRGAVSGTTLAYCPHAFSTGSAVTEAVDRILGGRRLDVLLASFTLLDLPWYLGGIANLGAEAALDLAVHFQPRFVVPTHDGPKVDSGFIAHVQRLVPFPDVAGGLEARQVAAGTLPDTVGQTWTIA